MRIRLISDDTVRGLSRFAPILAELEQLTLSGECHRDIAKHITYLKRMREEIKSRRSCSTKVAAGLLGCTTQWITELLNAGELEGEHRCKGGPWKVLLASLEKHLSGQVRRTRGRRGTRAIRRTAKSSTAIIRRGGAHAQESTAHREQ